MVSAEDLLQEVRKDVKNLLAAFADFKGRVVMKEELELWQEARRTTRQWAIATLLTIITVATAMATVAIVLNA